MTIEALISELSNAHREGMQKYTYFLLAAAGTAIGFAVQKTDGSPLSWSLLPVAAATLAWAGSFYCGCKNLHWVHASMSANYNLLKLGQGSHPEQPPHPELTQAAMSGVRSALLSNVDRAASFAIWQFRLLISGAVLFIGWRVVEMVRIT